MDGLETLCLIIIIIALAYWVNDIDKKLKKLEDHLNSVIVGQGAAKRALIKQTAQILADVHDRKRPRIMALLTGPKGRGKTELAIAYADGMGLPYHVIVFDEFADLINSGKKEKNEFERIDGVGATRS